MCDNVSYFCYIALVQGCMLRLNWGKVYKNNCKQFYLIFPNIYTLLKWNFCNNFCSFWVKDSIHIFSHESCVLQMFWVFAVLSSFHKGQWPSVCLRTYLVVREETGCLCWSPVVCLCAGCSPNFRRLLAESILNAFWFITLATFMAHICRYSAYTLITVVATKWQNILNYHFFGYHLPVFLLSTSTFWKWPLYTDKIAGFDIYTLSFFLFNNQPYPLNYPNLFCHKTLHVSCICYSLHQEFSTVHSALVIFMQVLMSAS